MKTPPWQKATRENDLRSKGKEAIDVQELSGPAHEVTGHGGRAASCKEALLKPRFFKPSFPSGSHQGQQGWYDERSMWGSSREVPWTACDFSVCLLSRSCLLGHVVQLGERRVCVNCRATRRSELCLITESLIDEP